jgi:hypothetical protein
MSSMWQMERSRRRARGQAVRKAMPSGELSRTRSWLARQIVSPDIMMPSQLRRVGQMGLGRFGRTGGTLPLSLASSPSGARGRGAGARRGGGSLPASQSFMRASTCWPERLMRCQTRNMNWFRYSLKWRRM